MIESWRKIIAHSAAPDSEIVLRAKYTKIYGNELPRSKLRGIALEMFLDIRSKLRGIGPEK